MTIQIELDEQTVQRAQQVAGARLCSVANLVKELLEPLSKPALSRDPFEGMFADEPELMDEVVESAMKAREEQPLRRSGG